MQRGESVLSHNVISSSGTRVTLGSSGVFLAGSCFLFYEIYSDFMVIDSFLLSKKSWVWFSVEIFFFTTTLASWFWMDFFRGEQGCLSYSYVFEQISGSILGTVFRRNIIFGHASVVS